MSKLGNIDYWGATLFGAMSAVSAAISLEIILNAANSRAVILQTQLAKAPELTAQVYDSSIAVANRMTSGDLVLGITFAAVAGYIGGMAIYQATRK